MFDRDPDRAQAAGVAETLRLLWIECFEHKSGRDGSGLSDKEVWNMLAQEVRSEDFGSWWKEWMAEQSAERLGFAQVVTDNDKE
eukprot:8244435-Alexandrium_andersonii.AAC.1